MKAAPEPKQKKAKIPNQVNLRTTGLEIKLAEAMEEFPGVPVTKIVKAWAEAGSSQKLKFS